MRNSNHATEMLAVSGQNGKGEGADVGRGSAPVTEHPTTIVIQPCRALTQENSSAFQQSLESALDLAHESVIVDLLWVETADAAGIAALVGGIEKAAHLGKMISFQAMRHQTRVAMETEWERQRLLRLGVWHDRCEATLEQFLGESRKSV